MKLLITSEILRKSKNIFGKYNDKKSNKHEAQFLRELKRIKNENHEQ